DSNAWNKCPPCKSLDSVFYSCIDGTLLHSLIFPLTCVVYRSVCQTSFWLISSSSFDGWMVELPCLRILQVNVDSSGLFHVAMNFHCLGSLSTLTNNRFHPDKCWL